MTRSEKPTVPDHPLPSPPPLPRESRPETESWWAKAANNKPPVISALTMVGISFTAAMGIGDPYKRALVCLGCAVTLFLIGWLHPKPE